jgi:hypothetical protein
MKRSNNLIADFPPPPPREPNRPDRPPALSPDETGNRTDKSSGRVPERSTEHQLAPTAASQWPANLAGFRARRQRPHRTHATASVAPFYVETEAG